MCRRIEELTANLSSQQAKFDAERQQWKEQMDALTEKLSRAERASASNMTATAAPPATRITGDVSILQEAEARGAKQAEARWLDERLSLLTAQAQHASALAEKEQSRIDLVIQIDQLNQRQS